MPAATDDSPLVVQFRLYLDEGTRALRQQMAALNKGRIAAGMPPLKIVEVRPRETSVR